jgi:integrative and conjugative element protein (TIGR02256 family)
MTIVQMIRLVSSAAEAMRRESRRRYPRETGGILIGSMEASWLNVFHVVGPGPHAYHGLRRFVRDGNYAQQELDAHYIASEGQVDYIGEWHSHPLPAGPSPQDRASLSWISANTAYHQEHPILMICQHDRGRHWSFQAYQWQAAELVQLDIAIL